MQYNLVPNNLLDVCDVIGGCFQAHQCRCGYKFCVGDILRRLHDGCSTSEDMIFFVSDKEDRVSINLDVLKTANEMFESIHRVVGNSAGGDYVISDVLDAVRAKMGIKTPISVSMLMDRFNTYVSPKAYAPTYRPAFHSK